MKFQRFLSTVLVSAGLLAAGIAPAAADQPAVLTAITVVQDIPIQPLADSTGRPIIGSQALAATEGSIAPQQAIVTPMNEPVWTRTCDRGHGLEIWNNSPAQSCVGTMYYYYYNVEKKHFNMAAFLAAQGSANRGYTYLMSKLDPWCSAHSFQCTVAVAAAFFGAAVLFG